MIILLLALNMTEIVVLTKKRIQTILPMLIGEEAVVTKPGAKYLRVLIDSKLCFFGTDPLDSRQDCKGSHCPEQNYGPC